ncbi:glycosyltransferase family 4 protein [Mesorhizobium sp. M4B.F.Ca.ET.017.02.2.1]|uniref:glycosyltransferase family 4 protein n=1 Tax=Mesorhizobium sp. M4B.F.Ca.ET.017.02.2.1 TaxID=2496649 RepID=UPI000FCAC287|nr:glycosyltransferase family 4 protein [Mesorhizobium sp. M4B.F.Ca.ET.017.02.2.1]RVD20673.1 glycosyl transferase family 1 [Mesorhizobium sp. M4B.F.Ca.ET.017.02.2.1]
MILNSLRRFRAVAARDGLRVATRKAINRAAKGIPVALQGKIDVFRHYETLLGEEQGLGIKISSNNVPEGSMTWLVPDFNASSGGHINILRFMALLSENGFPEQRLVVVEPHRWNSNAEAQAALNAAFGDNGIVVSLGARSIEPCQYLVATGWQTAYWVSKYKDAAQKLYFVQDFEPAFYAHGTEYVLAENTYRLGLTGITAGGWLADKLHDDYGMRTVSFDFACDLELYKPQPKRPSKTKHIFFYARPVTPRRCFELGLLALKKVCERVPNAAVIFAGWDVSGYEIPFHHLNAGTLAVSSLPDLYSQCDVGLILSSTNLSLLPLEMAACGCPLVINRGAHATWLLPEEEVYYCDMDVDSIAARLVEALEDTEETAKRAALALKRAQGSSWEAEAEKISVFLRELK